MKLHLKNVIESMDLSLKRGNRSIFDTIPALENVICVFCTEKFTQFHLRRQKAKSETHLSHLFSLTSFNLDEILCETRATFATERARGSISTDGSAWLPLSVFI
jgi:hypothetical protein